MSGVPMDERKLAVLRAIVTDYVSSQEPVGSRALVERHQLDVSPATVRNDMAILEEEGYIAQPHTSAGRIPTDKGYRLFVDRLASVKPLSPAEKKAISSFLEGAADLDDVVLRTVRLLAQLTQQVAIVQYPVVASAQIRGLDVVPLHHDRALVVLVDSGGRVQQRQVDLGTAEVEVVSELRNRFAAALIGESLSQCGARLAGVVEEFPAAARPRAAALSAALADLIDSDSAMRVAVGGVQHLARFGERFESNVKPVLEALEEQVVLLRLLGDVANSGDVLVRIGHENPISQLQGTSVVASGYSAQDDVWANLGVVGPTRMDYPSTMASVRAIARYVGRFLSEG